MHIYRYVVRWYQHVDNHRKMHAMLAMGHTSHSKTVTNECESRKVPLYSVCTLAAVDIYCLCNMKFVKCYTSSGSKIQCNMMKARARLRCQFTLV